MDTEEAKLYICVEVIIVVFYREGHSLFFLITILEFVLFLSGLSMFQHHRIGTGAALVILAIVLFLLTSSRYLARQRTPGSCCGETECAFLEGFACAECVDSGIGGIDCVDCEVIDCAN